MLANIRRQHEVWTDYLAEAGQGTLPYSHVTVTRPQQYVRHANLHVYDVHMCRLMCVGVCNKVSIL